MGSRGVGKRRAIRLEEKSCLSTELASVLGVLGDLSLLDDLTEGGTITSTVLTGDTDLGGSATLGSKILERSRPKIYGKRNSYHVELF